MALGRLAPRMPLSKRKQQQEIYGFVRPDTTADVTNLSTFRVREINEQPFVISARHGPRPENAAATDEIKIQLIQRFAEINRRERSVAI